MGLRKFARYESENLLNIITLDKHGNESTHSMAKTLDICIDGLSMEIQTPLEEGKRVRLTLGLKGQLINIEGVTVYCIPHGNCYVAGLSFLKVTKEERKKLQYHIDQFHKNNTITNTI